MLTPQCKIYYVYAFTIGGAISTQQQAGASGDIHHSIEEFIQHFLTNPEELAMLQHRSPQLAQALLTGNVQRIREAYMLHREQLMVSHMNNLGIHIQC